MSITLSIALFFVIWWVTLFAVLPFGVRTQEEDGDVVPGTPESAPVAPRLARVFMINTIVASIVFALVWAIVTYEVIPLSVLGVPGGR